MARIRLNYDKIEDIIIDMERYEKSLKKMKSEVSNVDKMLDEQEGKAIDGLKENSGIVSKEIDRMIEQVNDVRKLLEYFLDDMEGHIKANRKASDVIVDTLDIDGNIRSIEYTTRRFKTSVENGYTRSNVIMVSEEDALKHKRNKAKLNELINDKKSVKKVVDDSIDGIKHIYKKNVVKYADEDKNYSSKVSREIYNKYTSNNERVKNNLDDMSKIGGDILEGLWDLVCDISDMAVRNLMIASALTNPIGWFLYGDVVKEEINNYYNVLSDPLGYLEGTCQSILDGYNENPIKSGVKIAGITAMFLFGKKITTPKNKLTTGGKIGYNIKTGKIEALPKNVQDAYSNYDKNGWKGNYKGQTKGTNAGGKYTNNKGTLPTKDRNGKSITYKEYDVDNKTAGKNRSSRRFVKGSDGSIYYTDDHYKTFIKVK